MTEFALVAPLAFLLLAGAATGGQLMVAAINLTQAARAGAVTAAQDYQTGTTPNQETQDAWNSANDELGGSNSISCTSGGGASPLPCVTTNNTAESDTSAPEEVQVKLWQTVTPLIPLLSGITISSSATAPGIASS